MDKELSHEAVAMLVWVFDLAADLSTGTSARTHRRGRRRQAPSWRSRRQVQAGKVVILVAGGALLCGNPLPSCAAADGHRVSMTVIALPGKIAGGVAIETPRMS